ncbi:hypothetical protein EDC04DRAFT_2603976 [Pisolithus marmoratus]|nr:hypothetical protein EDC04DRAFT_2603976 [Pisolithus marmoratus]
MYGAIMPRLSAETCGGVAILSWHNCNAFEMHIPPINLLPTAPSFLLVQLTVYTVLYMFYQSLPTMPAQKMTVAYISEAWPIHTDPDLVTMSVGEDLEPNIGDEVATDNIDDIQIEYYPGTAILLQKILFAEFA